jgi:hypothetical protein
VVRRGNWNGKEEEDSPEDRLVEHVDRVRVMFFIRLRSPLYLSDSTLVFSEQAVQAHSGPVRRTF